ncbi:MAG: VanZ family protein [Pseudomonadota bacterium]
MNTKQITVSFNYRKILIWAGIGYVLFVIYGSLVPLDFRPMSLSKAISSFHNIPYLSLNINARADLAANIILFIPIPFLWMSILSPKAKIVNSAISSLLIFSCCMALSITIEFAQIFFPPRTVSMNDVMAESIGAVMGIICWLSFGRMFLRWLSEIKMFQTPFSIAHQLLWLYMGGFLFYNLMPFDLTISITEIYRKWKAGRIIVTPLIFLNQETPKLIYECITDMVLWIPPALLSVLSSIKSAATLWGRLTLVAALIEFMQIFVYSRVTDLNDIVMASAGIGIGVCCGARLRPRWGKKAVEETGFVPSRLILWGLAGTTLWSLVLILIFWYPFDFYMDKQFIRNRLLHFIKAPLTTYYYGTEYRALTEVLHKILFFVPLGVFLSLTVVGRSRRPLKLLLDFCWISAITVIAFSIELGQILLPKKFADITDCFFMVMGGLCGYIGAQKFYQKAFSGTRSKTEIHGTR